MGRGRKEGIRWREGGGGWSERGEGTRGEGIERRKKRGGNIGYEEGGSD